MRKIIVFFVILVLTACSYLGEGNASFDDELQRWIGRPEYQLYQVWGRPDRIYSMAPQTKVLTYIRTSSHGTHNPYSNEIYYGGVGEEHWWNDLFGPPEQKQRSVYYCKISFIVQSGYISNYQFNGDDCVAS